MPQFSLKNDINNLNLLTKNQIRGILDVLCAKEPDEYQIENNIPNYVLRLLPIYNAILANGGLEKLTGSIVDIIQPMWVWMADNLPGVANMPGFSHIVKYTEKIYPNPAQLYGESPVTPTRAKILDRQVGTINGANSVQLFTGQFNPALRIFLMHDDHVLLDSHGGWDEWLFTAVSIMRFVSDHARNVSGFSPVWENLPTEKLKYHIQNLTENLEAFSNELDANTAPQSKAKQKRVSKNKKADSAP